MIFFKQLCTQRQDLCLEKPNSRTSSKPILECTFKLSKLKNVQIMNYLDNESQFSNEPTSSVDSNLNDSSSHRSMNITVINLNDTCSSQISGKSLK